MIDASSVTATCGSWSWASPDSGGLAWRISRVSASLTSMPTGRCAWSSSSSKRSLTRDRAPFRLPAGLVLVESLCRVERVAKDDPFGSDLELADLRFVAGRAGLQDGEGASNGGLVADVREHHDVVGEAADLEEVGQLRGHEQAHALAREALDERVHVFAEPDLVRRGELEIGEAVDEDAACARALHRLEQVVDPLVGVDVDRRAVHELDAILVSRPTKPLDDPRELGRVFLERREHARFALTDAVENEVQAHQSLAGARRARAERRGSRPVAVGEHLVEGRDAG